MNDDPSSSSIAADPAGTARADDLEKKSGHFLNFLRVFTGKNGESTLRDTFEEIIEEHDDRDTPINPDEKRLIENILRLGDLTAYDVMVPRADIVSIAMDVPASDALQIMIEQPHSRYPVYDENPDDVIGMVHIKDVFGAIATQGKQALNLRDIYRQILVVSPSVRILDLLLEMRVKRLHMAVVVDEYGGIDGLITIEDLVEQIVGEIQDEHDVVAGPLLQLSGEGVFIANARLEMSDLEREIGPFLTDEERDEDIDTINGYILWEAGRVPARGELLVHQASGLEFEILEADPRRVKRVALRNIPDTAPIIQEEES